MDLRRRFRGWTMEASLWYLVGSVVIVWALAWMGCKPAPQPNPDPPPVNPDPGELELTETEQELLDLHMDHRRELGLFPTNEHHSLMLAARKHAQWMADYNIMSHTGNGGTTFWERMTKEGYRGNGGGENIAAGYQTPARVFDAWLGSYGHRKNINEPSWQDIGVGTAVNARTGTRFWCVVFGRGHSPQNKIMSWPDLTITPMPLEKGE